MLKELAEYLVAQSAPTTLTFDGLQYVNRSMNLVAPPMVPKLTVNTLTGLVDALRDPLPKIADDAWVLWVESYKAVSLVALRGDRFGRRPCLVRAELPDGMKPFRFDTFHGPAGCRMTSHRDPIRHPHPLCANCHQREAMVSLNARRSPKSRKSKRGGVYKLKAHDLCNPCWRALCAQYWVHGGTERAKDQMEASGPRRSGDNSPSPQRLDGSLSYEVSA